MVAEGHILLRVQHLEQRRRRVAVERVAPELVNLVEHDDAVIRARLADGLHDEPREGANVRAPVAAHLRLRVHAAQGDALEVAAERRGDRLAERRLSDPWGALHAEYGSLGVATELADGEELEDALLDLLHPEVILLQLRARHLHLELLG